MARKVMILMSTYNGGERIKKQVDTILDQEDALTSVLIRDDGSDTVTQEILRSIKYANSDRVKIIFADNIGWRKSFHALLHSELAIDYDYYGFSDQDDVWMPDKLISCISLMENDPWDGPKLAHCNAITANEDLSEREEKEHRITCPPNHFAAFATEYFQGCAMVWNEQCMKLLRRYTVQDNSLSHDYWAGLIATLFGKVYFCNEPKFYHIRYSNSESSDGSVKKGRLARIRSLASGKNAYMNPARDLLNGYSDLLDDEDKNFLKKLSNYKTPKNKIAILQNSQFRRPSRLSTLLMKFAILTNQF